MNRPNFHVDFDLAAKIFYDSQNERNQKIIDNALEKLAFFKNPNYIEDFTPLTIDNEKYYLIKEGKVNIIFQSKKDEFLINDIISGSFLNV